MTHFWCAELPKFNAFYSSNWIFLFDLDIQNFEYGSPEHVVMWREMDHLLTWAAGNGNLVQISIKNKQFADKSNAEFRSPCCFAVKKILFEIL